MMPLTARRAYALASLIFAIFACVSDATAVKHRRPFGPAIALGYGFDNNAAGNGTCTNYACGSGTCYDGHTGSDFPVGYGTDVVAGAPGTVLTVVQGCADVGYLGNPCGGKCGNYVKLQHADGTTTIYCHMKNGSIVVGQGQGVGCGQKLGQSASSGSSTGYHLHFGWTAGSTRDPFSGGCATGGGWVEQGAFGTPPGAGCEVACQCSPGQTQSQGCGNCGSQSRTCNGNCQWGGWSGCQGQGACAPGAAESEACCDCGSRVRTCTGGCQWGPWGGCGGPDPSDAPACSTGELGECAAGVVRCKEGCTTCVRQVEPSLELCDGRDTDCDGAVDEDAELLGDPPPELAARIEDVSAPTALVVGEQALVWAQLRNLGSAPWPAGIAWLRAEAQAGGPSPLWVPDAWTAHDVPVAVEQEVSSGDGILLAFPIAMPGGAVPVATRFEVVVHGVTVACPAPSFTVAPVRLSALDVEVPAEAPERQGGDALGSGDGDANTDDANEVDVFDAATREDTSLDAAPDGAGGAEEGDGTASAGEDAILSFGPAGSEGGCATSPSGGLGGALALLVFAAALGHLRRRTSVRGGQKNGSYSINF